MFLQIVFILSALLTVLSALMVVFTRHIMYSAIYLLGSLIGVAGLYLTLGADVLAATQLLVYVGGVVIIMVFAIMLTGGQDFMKNVKFSLAQVPFMGNLRTYLWGGFAAIVLGSILVKLMSNIVMKFSSSAEVLSYQSTVEVLGKQLVTEHVLVFEIASILLLGALIGAATIARPAKRKE